MKKMMKKMLALTLVLVMVLTLFAGCAGEKPSSSGDPKPGTSEPVKESVDPGKTYTLRMASPASSKSITAKFMQWYCDEVTARSGGRLTIQYFPDSQLYAPAEIPEAVISGAIELAHCSTAVYWPNVCPVFNYTQSWFLWRTGDQVYGNIEDYRDLLFPLWEDMGVQPLFFVSQGEGGLLTKVSVQKPEDLKGLVMRGSSSPDWAAMEALGATPVQMSVNESYDALEKGALDGVRASYSNFVQKQMYDVCKYLLPGVSMTLFGILVNPDIWADLPSDLQDLMMEVGAEVEKRSFEDHAAEEGNMLATLGEHCEIYELSEEEIATFQAALEDTYANIQVICDEQGFGEEAKRFMEIASR